MKAWQLIGILTVLVLCSIWSIYDLIKKFRVEPNKQKTEKEETHD